MQLKLGDRLVDETAEWEVAGRPYVTNQGKTAHARVRRVDQPEVTPTDRPDRLEETVTNRQPPRQINAEDLKAP